MAGILKIGILAIAVAIALFFAWWGGSVVYIINADYKDGKDSTYLVVGGLLLAFAAMTAIATLASGLPQHMTRGQILLGIPVGVALLAGALAYIYYGPPVNSVPDHHRGPPPPARSFTNPG